MFCIVRKFPPDSNDDGTPKSYNAYRMDAKFIFETDAEAFLALVPTVDGAIDSFIASADNVS